MMRGGVISMIILQEDISACSDIPTSIQTVFTDIDGLQNSIVNENQFTTEVQKQILNLYASLNAFSQIVLND